MDLNQKEKQKNTMRGCQSIGMMGLLLAVSILAISTQFVLRIINTMKHGTFIYSNTLEDIIKMYETDVSPASFVFYIWILESIWKLSSLVFITYLICKRHTVYDTGNDPGSEITLPRIIAPQVVTTGYLALVLGSIVFDMASVSAWDSKYSGIAAILDAFTAVFATGALYICGRNYGRVFREMTDGLRKFYNFLLLNPQMLSSIWFSFRFLFALVITLVYQDRVGSSSIEWFVCASIGLFLGTGIVLEVFLWREQLRNVVTHHLVIIWVMFGMIIRHYNRVDYYDRKTELLSYCVTAISFLTLAIKTIVYCFFCKES